MKKLALVLALIVVSATTTFAQKYAFVDTDYILNAIPEYKAAQEELDKVSTEWQRQIEGKYAEIDQLYKSYQAEQVLLTEEMKAKKENEIIQKEKEAKQFQKSKFGVEGELFKKRESLIQPIQDKIFKAIKEMAERGSYAMIIDKKGGSLIFTNPKYDKSDAVLKKLGISGGKK